MGWADRASLLLDKYAPDIPRPFMLGWIRAEETNNAAPPTSIGEVGWFQIHPDEAKDLGIDLSRVPVDEDYSVQAGVQLVRHRMQQAMNANAVPYGSEAFYALAKLYHFLPLMASQVAGFLKKMGYTPSKWSELKTLIETNEPSLEKGILGPNLLSRGVHNVDVVLGFPSGLIAAGAQLVNQAKKYPALPAIGLAALAAMIILFSVPPSSRGRSRRSTSQPRAEA